MMIRRCWLLVNACISCCMFRSMFVSVAVFFSKCLHQLMYVSVIVCISCCMFQSLFVSVAVCFSQCLHQLLYVSVNVCISCCMFQRYLFHCSNKSMQLFIPICFLFVAGSWVDAAPDPIGFWLLNDKYGAPFADMSNHGRDAVPLHVSLDNPTPDTLVSFAHFEHKKNSTVVLGSSPIPLKSFTFAAAIRPDGNTIDFNGPILTWAPEATYGTHIWQNMGGILYVRIVALDGSTINLQLLGGIELGKWNIISVAFNASTGYLFLRVNTDTWGAAPSTPFTGATQKTSGKLQLGYHGDVDYDIRAYRGYISCVSLFNEYIELTLEDVKRLRQTCFGPIDPKNAPVASCEVSGRAHYRQFDNNKVHHQGTCRYIMAQDGCNAGLPTSGNSESFRVIVEGHRQEADIQADSVKEVIIQLPLYSLEIVMRQGKWSALVNGSPAPSFPASINEYVQLTASKTRMFLTTSMGLAVLWDGESYVKVIIEGQYAGTTCGICGVYNKNNTDDSIMGPVKNCDGVNPNVGMPAMDVDMLVRSWMYELNEEDPLCMEECSEPPIHPLCSVEKAPPARLHCATFERPQGPFKKCILKMHEVGSEEFVEVLQNCAYDRCITDNDNIVCEHAKVMADICANKYETPVHYRHNTFCPMRCSNGSYIEPCGRICEQKTCSDRAPECTEKDLSICEELCVCDEGYVLHNGECIQEADCGCPYDVFNTIIALGDSIITEDCSQECTCNSPGGNLTCTNLACAAGMQCSVVDGDRGCHCLPPQIMFDGKCVGPATCRCSGDPHCESFDGTTNKFMGACKYILAQDNCVMGVATDEPNFVVAADYWRRGLTKKKLAWVRSVVVLIDGFRIELKEGGNVTIDGEAAVLPTKLNSHIDVFDMPNYVFVTTNYGLQVMWDRKFSVRVTVSPALMNQTCGTCGNFNLEPADDWQIGPELNGSCAPPSDGSPAKIGDVTDDLNVFGHSWLFETDNDDDCKKHCKEEPPPACNATTTAEAEAACDALRNATGPLKNCIAAMPPKEVEFFFSSCVFDTCNDNGSYVCVHGAEMASQCIGHYNVTTQWRKPGFCPPECPANSVYHECAPECVPSCNDLSASKCHPSGVCEEGCACKEGFVYAGNKCVLPIDCGCKAPGSSAIIRPGEPKLSANCSSICSCLEHGAEPVCVPHQCRADQECQAEGADMVCRCPAFSAEKNNTCEGHPVCSCSGDPHCKQFDKGSFSYHGSCKYTLAQDGCRGGLPYSQPNWQVIINNVRPKPKKPVARVDEVTVIFPKEGVKIDLKQGGTVFVDGAVITPPRTYNNKIAVYDRPNYVYVSAPQLGVQVMWDRVYSVRTIVVPELEGDTCGLCGIFNHNSSDDMVIGPATKCMDQFDNPKVGQQTSKEDVFGSSWFHEMDETDPICNQDCSEEEEETEKCDPALQALADSKCAVLTDKKGPLGECIKLMSMHLAKRIQRDCVFDICAMNDTSLACQHATSLVQDCIAEHGVKGNISTWRSKELCPMECSSDTTYQICGPSCTATCDDIHGLRCKHLPDECTEGCFCDADKLWNGQSCVHKDKCDWPCSICDFMVNTNTATTYDSWVECFTCDAKTDADCHHNGSYVACVEPSAICFTRRTFSEETLVSVARGCYATASCPVGSMGKDGVCRVPAEGIADKECIKCSYGDVIPNDKANPVFRCGLLQTED